MGGHCGASLWALRWESQSELRVGGGRPSVVVGSAELLRRLQDSSHVAVSNRSGDERAVRQRSQRAKAAAAEPRLTSAVGGGRFRQATALFTLFSVTKDLQGKPN